ncbi:MAG: rhomboid family intramembrane serine protease [Kofleriaceae bacterium]
MSDAQPDLVERDEPSLPSPARSFAHLLRTETPWVTYALLAALGLGFVLETAFAVRPSGGLLEADVMTLISTGGLMQSLVRDGEWYRLFTCAFLHADLFHLALNGLVLFLAGRLLENLLGRAWVVAIFVVSALGGSALSLALNAPEVVSVGASGAIMGMLAAAFVCLFRFPSDDRAQVQLQLFQILIPSLIPLVSHRIGGKVDYAAHIGGAIVGVLVGLVLLWTWRRSEPRPRLRAAARAVAVCGVALFVIGAVLVAKNHATYADAAAAAANEELLIPNAALPRTEADMVSQADSLVNRFPRDPRTRLFHALRLVKDGDAAGAQVELRRGLDETEILRVNFPNRELEIAMRAFLAELLLGENKPQEAEHVAAPVCKAGEGGAVPGPLRELAVCK